MPSCFIFMKFLFLASVFSQAQSPVVPDVFAINRAMSPGINYGNVFEADPPEGWHLSAKEEDFKIMAVAGFKGVRLPVRWNAEALETAPYTVDPVFLARVDRMVHAALDAGLSVVLDFHHCEPLFQDPQGARERFLAIWGQLSAHYSAYPRTLLFEILNEPHGKLTPALWNPLMKEALAKIRARNPDRVVVLEGGGWGGVGGLNGLAVPLGDPNLILSFHDYTPMRFTHQGASWVGAQSQSWLGTTWTGTFAEGEEMRKTFEQADLAGKRWGLPVLLGEYGAYSKADEASRVRWTTAMSRDAARFGFSRFYWEFKSGFGAWDEADGRWRDDLKNAIVLP